MRKFAHVINIRMAVYILFLLVFVLCLSASNKRCFKEPLLH